MQHPYYHRQTARNRRMPTGSILVFGLLSLLLLNQVAVGQESKSPNKIDIDNFGKVHEHYYRGAQPSKKEFKQLKQLGIKTVIDLQEDSEEDEAELLKELNINYFNIKLSSRRPPSDQQTAEFLRLTSNPQNWPVFVHCAGGRHRTGALTAAYRITFDGWTADQAYREMKQYKWYSYFGHGSLKDFVFNYYERRQAGAFTLP